MRLPPAPRRPRQGRSRTTTALIFIVVVGILVHMLVGGPTWLPCDPTALLASCMSEPTDYLRAKLADCHSTSPLDGAVLERRLSELNLEGRTSELHAVGECINVASVTGRHIPSDFLAAYSKLRGGAGSPFTLALPIAAPVAAATTNASALYRPRSRPVVADPDIAIIGGGPTGLCAALRLQELGHKKWRLYEREGRASGLAKSIEEGGFLWDVGVHIGFSHYEFYDKLLDTFVPASDWFTQWRSSPIYMEERFIGYPLQNWFFNLSAPTAAAIEKSLMKMKEDRAAGKPPRTVRNYEDWALNQFGDELCRVFITPYNSKVWAHHPRELNTVWVGERVSPLNIDEALAHKAPRNWGPNNIFRYPRHGTSQVWDNVFKGLDPAHASLHHDVVAIRPAANGRVEVKFNAQTRKPAAKGAGCKTDTFDHDGADTSAQTAEYDAVITTQALSITFPRFGIPGVPTAAPDKRFKHTQLHLVGVGLKGRAPPSLLPHHWVYYPEDKYPWYRLTVLSNLSPGMAPVGHHSLLVEVSESINRPFKWAGADELVEDVIASLVATGLIMREAIVHRFYHCEQRGYPVPYVERDGHVHAADNELRERGVWSRGRFGNWKYEVSNQDHSCMLGVEAVDNILFGSPEHTFVAPNYVNKLYRSHDPSVRVASVAHPPTVSYNDKLKNMPIGNNSWAYL